MATILLVGGDGDLSNDMAELLALAGYQVLGSPDTAQLGTTEARRLQPDMILLLSTMGLDSADGLETIRALLRSAPGARMVVWSARDSSIYVERVLGIGVSAYVSKNAAYDELLAVVKRVAAGETPGFVAPHAHV
ncbi:MAG: response regulator [Anaerolineae bacterium]